MGQVFPSESDLNSGFALSASYFSLLRQRKVAKRKAAPKACPLRGFPALLAGLGARRTRRICRAFGLQIQLKQGGSPTVSSIPLRRMRLAMLSCAYGFRGGAPDPVALAEYRSQTGQKERALFEASHDGIEDPVMAPSCARRPV